MPDTNLILLVDDSEDDAFFFKRTVKRSKIPCSVRYVRNGTLALQMLQTVLRSDLKDLPQAIFLDLKMPVINGFEVLEWIRAQTFPPELPVIILSGSEQAADKARATRLGATGYIVKPITVEDLQRLLPQYCDASSNAGADL